MRRKGEQGAIMIEATWCVLLVMFVFLFMLSFGFLLYQRVTVQVVANEMAEEVAQTYKLKEVEDSSSVTVNDIGRIGKYRFLLFANSFETASEAKAKTLTASRLTQTLFATEEGTLSVDVERIPDDVGRYHLEVTVSQRYGFLLGDFLEFIGQDDVQNLESTVYVTGTDVLYYVNSIHTASSLSSILSDIEIIGVVEDAIGILSNLTGLTG